MSAGRLEIALEGEAVAGAELALQVTRGGRPVIGQPVLEISSAGAVDRAQRTAGTTDAMGRLLWTPARSGLTLLEVGEDAVVVAVGPASALPGALAGGLALLLLLGAGLAVLRRGWP